MNTVLLNTVNLDDGRIIKKGGGGVTIKNQTKSVTIAENGNTVVSYDSGYTGLEKVSVKVAIPNEEKTVDITENGTTEVVATKGFLSKVIVNTNVTSGGGDDVEIPEDPTITCLYISIPKGYPKTVSVCYQQDIMTSHEIDWGDGSAVEKSSYGSGTATNTATHVYSKEGNYRISFKPLTSSASLTFGYKNDTNSIMGLISDYTLNYSNVPIQYTYLKQIHLGTMASIGDYGVMHCSNLTKISFADGYKRTSGPGKFAFYYSGIEEYEFPNSITSFSAEAFECAFRLKKVQLGKVPSIPNYAFFYCRNLYIIKLPSSVTSIGNNIAMGCVNDVIIDISEHTQIPTISTSSFTVSSSITAKVIVPDSLYEDIIIATNWSSITASIIKKSDWDAQNA